MIRRLLRLALALGFVACTPLHSSFHCTTDEQCRLGANTDGVCELDGYCSLPDSTCDSGRRYRAREGGDLCVGATMGCEVRIDAVHPDVAAIGDTVWVDGVFSDDAQIVFSSATGPLVVTPIKRGARRMSVVVPSGATRGTIAVRQGSCTSGGRAFEVIASQPALDGAFTSRNDDLRQASTAWIRTLDRVITLGASRSDDVNRAIDAATIAADGSLSPFVAAGQLATTRKQPCAIVIGDRLYVIGGHDGNDALASIESIALAAFPGTFTTESIALVTPRQAHACVVLGGWLYVLGGTAQPESNVGLATVERSPIAADGTLGAFVDAGTTLASGRTMFGVAAVGEWLYAFGGFDDPDLVTQIERAPIALADGTVGAFAATRAFTPTRNGVRAMFSTAHIGRRVFVVGGFSSGSFLDEILKSEIDAKDGLGSFETVAATLTSDRVRPTLVVLANRFYAIGGETSARNSLQTLDSTPLP